jgi:hypothetical protein
MGGQESNDKGRRPGAETQGKKKKAPPDGDAEQLSLLDLGPVVRTTKPK